MMTLVTPTTTALPSWEIKLLAFKVRFTTRTSQLGNIQFSKCYTTGRHHLLTVEPRARDREERGNDFA
jgi:hypothetical protein